MTPASQSSASTPWALLILMLIAEQLMPSADADLTCHVCNYGPKPEEPGAEVMCSNGKPGTGKVECSKGENACYAAHAEDLREGKRWVRGYGNCLSNEQIKCISTWGGLEIISVDEIAAHSNKKTCFNIKMDDADDDKQFIAKCLHPHNEEETAGNYSQFEICPCHGDMCNDGVGSPQGTENPSLEVITTGALSRAGGIFSNIISVAITGGIAAFIRLVIRKSC